MRTKRETASESTPTSSSEPPDIASLSLLQTATAAIMAPLTSQHRMVPAGKGNEGEDDDEVDEEGLLDDDGLSSSSSDEMEDALEGDEDGYLRHSPETESMTSTGPSSKSESLANQGPTKSSNLVPLPPLLATATARAVARQNSIPDYFDRPLTMRPGQETSASGLLTPSTPGATTPGGTKTRRPIFGRGPTRTVTASSGVETPGGAGKRKLRKKERRNFNFDTNQGKDVLGIVIMEIKHAADLPKIKNCKWFDLICSFCLVQC